MFLFPFFIRSHSQEGLLILISHMRTHQFTRQSKGTQAGLGHRDSIRSWFCHLDVRHMPSLPASSSLSLLSFVLLSVADHSCHHLFDIPHGRCHIIAARSRCAHHNLGDPGHDTPVFALLFQYKQKDSYPADPRGMSTSTGFNG